MNERDRLIAKAMGLPVWNSPRDPQILKGGITNVNIKLWDGGKAFVVRLGGDIETHMVKRFNEQACHRASEAVGLSPRIIYADDNVLAMSYIDGRTLDSRSIAQPVMLGRIARLLRQLHRQATRKLRGPVVMFWVFHVLRDYAARLHNESTVFCDELACLMLKAERLEQVVGPVDIALTHNDLLPANLIDTSERLWLIDWDYGGFNTPLFDLASVASNSALSSELSIQLLEAYYEASVSGELWRRFQAMVCASLLRETMWSMVSEISSGIDFDYRAYTAHYRARFDAAYGEFLML
ncbi:choline/ethanolamine kinase family protein [Acidocella sp.]|uniref:choline/ethanolamine kinase family protein n=1 Tax=Acidocella sp. TaxID=50710 RepID=UPI00262F15A0|nr:choline/ethanolamine kinase family protein [Acidocella sp.]